MNIESLVSMAKVLNLKPIDSRIVGVDIGSSTLKIIGLRTIPRPSILFYSIIKLPENCDDGYVSSVIQRVLRENKAAAKDAVLTFSDEAVTIRRMDIPRVAGGEIAEALKWQAKDVVHIEMDKASLDFELLGELRREDGSVLLRLLFLAMPNALIDKKIQAVKAANVNVVSVSALTFGMENILKMSDDPEDLKTVLVVDMGYKKTEISVFKNKALEFVRSIPVGSWHISEAMGGQITSEQGVVAFGRDEAEEIKKRLGISYEDMPVGKGVTSMQVLSLVRPVIERLSKEVRRSIDYYIQEYEGGEVSAIYLAGGGATLKNLGQYLGEELNVQVKKIGVPKSIDTSRIILNEGDALSIVPLIGIALGYKKYPNLLPHEYKVEKIEFVKKISLRMIALAVGGVLLVSFLLLKIGLGDYKQRLANMRLHKDILNQVKDLQEKVAEKEALLANLETNPLSTRSVMKEIISAIPPNVVLESLSADRQSKTVEMKGLIYASKGLAEGMLTKFMEDLERLPRFKDAQLLSVNPVREAREEASSFELTCSLE